MTKEKASYLEQAESTIAMMGQGGLLLVTQGKSGPANAMTIGWGLIGIVWGRPSFSVLVRPSRHTYQLLEENGEFTVNVMPREMAEVLAFCGTASGRDHDKFAEKKLTAVPGQKVRCPAIQEALIYYECRVLHQDDLQPDNVPGFIRSELYPQGDFHRIYHGEILATYAVKDARQRLALK